MLDIIPPNLTSLYSREEKLRSEALELIGGDERLQLHLAVVEAAMNIADTLRLVETNSEDLKLIQILGMRTFNAFAASSKLALSGYGQNSTLILRDVMETVFLIDLFERDRSLIERWRFADKQTRMKEFGPAKVRVALDPNNKKRAELYELFSELAGHATMQSASMMRPQPEGDAVIGPFMVATTLEAVVSEMGRLAIQVGEKLDLFFPAEWLPAFPSRLAFARLKKRWIATFYPGAAAP
jgi:hypothetical protein